MLTLSSLPSWASLHPAIAHFPIALLMTVPCAVGTALVLREHRRILLIVALCTTAGMPFRASWAFSPSASAALRNAPTCSMSTSSPAAAG